MKITTKIVNDSGERRKRQWYSLILRKPMTKSTDKTLEQLENMGTQRRLLRFIRELVSARWIKVKMGGSISQSKQTDLGIPQGWVLSVTFFLVAINSILGELRNGVDESLCRWSDNIHYNKKPGSDQQAGWGSREGLKNFFTSKTVNMIFRKRNEEPIEIMLRNKIILYKENTHFLGMTLDSRLNWEEHIKKLRAKAKWSLKTLKVVAGKKWGGDWKTLKILYSKICRIKIAYGCQYYNTATAGRLKKLNSIHRRHKNIIHGSSELHL